MDTLAAEQIIIDTTFVLMSEILSNFFKNFMSNMFDPSMSDVCQYNIRTTEKKQFFLPNHRVIVRQL